MTNKACVAAHLNTPAAAPVLAGAAPKPNAAPVLPPACHTNIYAKSKERHTMPKRVFAGAPAVHSNHPPVCARMACVKSSVLVFTHLHSLKMVIIDANFLKLSRIPCISASSGCMCRLYLRGRRSECPCCSSRREARDSGIEKIELFSTQRTFRHNRSQSRIYM